MLLRKITVLTVAGWMLICDPVSAQTQVQAPAQPAQYNTISDRTIRQEEGGATTTDDDKKVLAQQMDQFNNRLKALEQGAGALDQAQEDGSFVERLDGVDKELKAYDKAVERIDGALGNFPKMGHGDMTMKVFGRIHLDTWTFASVGDDIDALEGGDPQNRIFFRRMRLGVSGNIDTNMFYKFEGEFAGGNLSEYRDAYLGFDYLPLFNKVFIGNHKRPYGLDHLNSSRYNVFLERPFAVEAFNEDARRIGISSNGVSEDMRYNWRYGIWNMQRAQSNAGYIGDDFQPEIAWRFADTWWWDEASNGRGYAHFGASGSYREPDGTAINNASRYRTRPEARSTRRWLNTGRIDGASQELLTGLEGVVNVGPWQVVGEYQYSDIDRIEAFGNNVRFSGGYVQASYFLTGEHIPWNRNTGTIGRIKPYENFFSVCDCDGFVQRGMGAWQIAARYSYADFSDQNIDGGRGQATSLALNWYWNAYARLQMNYMIGDIESATTVAGDYQIFGARFMIDF